MIEEKCYISMNAEDQLIECIKEDAFREKGTEFGRAVEDAFDEQGIEVLLDAGFQGVTYDITDMLRQDYKLNIMLATEEELNLCNSTMDFYSAVLLDEKSPLLSDEQDFERYSDNALTYPVHQQGYSVNDVVDCIHEEEFCESMFIRSVAEEIEDADFHYKNSELVMCVSGNGKELLDVMDKIAHQEGNLEVPKETTIGLFDSVNGTCSDLSIIPEQPVIFPAEMINDIQIEGAGEQNRYYTVDETCGFISKVWENDITPTNEEPVLSEENMHDVYEHLTDLQKQKEKDSVKEY